MKRYLSILLSVVLIVSASAVSIGSIAAPWLNLGTRESISGTVNTKSGSVSVSASAYPEQATGMFNAVNKRRLAAGLSELTRATNLSDAAKQRALEITVHFSHTRPDGSKWSTVASGANGENVAVDMANYVDVTQGFMDSPTHKDNILDSDFTSLQVYCVERDGQLYWVQLFGAKGSSTTDTPKTTAKKPSSADSVIEAPKSGTALVQSTLVSSVNNAVAKNGVKLVSVDNAYSVMGNSLQAMQKAAGGNTTLLQADTRTAEGKFIGRLTINPKEINPLAGEILLGIEIDNNYTEATQAFFAKWFKNQTQVVGVRQPGEFGGTVRVAAKMTLTDYDKDNLVFYVYNRDTNKYSNMTTPNYSIDANGFIHFDSTTGGDIVISNGTLTK